MRNFNVCLYSLFSSVTSFHFDTSSWFPVIRKDSRYTEKDAAVVVRQMLKVAAECHLHGLVHRDMKPEVYSVPFFFFIMNVK